MEVGRLELRCISRHEASYGKAFLRDGNSDTKPVGARHRCLSREKHEASMRIALVMQISA